MKRLICILTALFSGFSLFAESKLFAGARGDFFIPAWQNGSKVLGPAAGGEAEFGLYVGNLSFGIIGGLSKTIGKAELVESFIEKKIGAEAGLTFDKNIFSFFPEAIAIRLNIAGYANIFEAEGYRHSSKKEYGIKEKTTGVSPTAEAGLYFELPTIHRHERSELIPYAGFAYNIRFEEDGPFHSGVASLGVRFTYDVKPDVQIETLVLEDNAERGVLVINAPIQEKLFTPDGDGDQDIVHFNISSDADEHGGAASWELRIYDPGSHIFYRESGSGTPPAEYTWDGKGSKGELVESGSIYQYVWYVRANDGTDGFIPGIIPTGIMMKEDNGVLSFSLPSIQFGPDSAGFEKLSTEVQKRNQELFDLVADVLNKYAQYDVLIEGHANNVSGTERENIQELIPLSSARSQTVKSELEKRGIAANRMTTVGRGSSAMVTTVKQDAWKNRRVEFILKKR